MKTTKKLLLAFALAASSLFVVPTTTFADQSDNITQVAWYGRGWARPYYRPYYQPYNNYYRPYNYNYRPYYQPYYQPNYRPYNYFYGAPRVWYWG